MKLQLPRLFSCLRIKCETFSTGTPGVAKPTPGKPSAFPQPKKQTYRVVIFASPRRSQPLTNLSEGAERRVYSAHISFALVCSEWKPRLAVMMTVPIANESVVIRTTSHLSSGLRRRSFFPSLRLNWLTLVSGSRSPIVPSPTGCDSPSSVASGRNRENSVPLRVQHLDRNLGPNEQMHA